MYIQVLGVTPGDTEYLAISCYECRKIRLVDLDLQYVTLGYTHHRYKPGYMIPGDDHTIFVHMVDSEVVVELAYYSWGSSSLVQVTRTETPGVSAQLSVTFQDPRGCWSCTLSPGCGFRPFLWMIMHQSGLECVKYKTLSSTLKKCWLTQIKTLWCLMRLSNES